MKNKYSVVLTALSVVVLLLAFVVTSCGDKNDNLDEQSETSEQETVKIAELQVLSTTETGDWVVVETTYGEFRYPFAFSDIIGVEVANRETSAELQFYMRMNENNIAIYTIHYNEDIGVPCGQLKLSDNTNEIVVSVEFENAAETMAEDMMETFYATQETFNDVLFSMGEDSRFTILE